MKPWTYILLPVALLLSGCDGDGWTEMWNAGTTKAFAACLRHGEMQRLSEPTVRRRCLEKHQRSIANPLAGEARYTQGTFQGRVTNKGADFIVTEYSVALTHSAAPKTDAVVFSQRFIEPQQNDSFEVYSLSYFPMANPDRNKDKFSWETKDIKGLRIQF